jgi:ATP-dependent Lon protease
MADEAVNLTTAEEEQAIPEHLPVLPLHQGVLFPELTVPLLVSRPDHIKLVDEALVKDRALVAVAQRDNTVEKPALVDLYRVGVAAFISRAITTYWFAPLKRFG